MVSVFYFLVYIIESIIAYIYFNENYNIKQKIFNSLLITLGLYSVGFGINILCDNNYIINDIVFLIINIIYSKLSFEISLKSSILHSSILLAIMTLSEMVVEAGASYLLNIPMDAYKHSIYALIILGTISKVLYLVICIIISNAYSYKKNNEPNHFKKNLILFLYPIMTTIMLLIFLYASDSYQFSPKINLAFAISSILSLVFCCFIFIINQSFQIQENKLIVLQSENQRNEMNQVFYEILEKKNEEQRILVHDIKHHLAAINSMDDICDIKKYVANVQPELDEYKYIGKTKNKMLDLILDRYASICNTKSVDFHVDIRTSNLSFIEDKDLVSILSNILDNAVEATVKTDCPIIRFSTKMNKNFVIVTVINSCLEKPKSDGEKLITTKSNSSYHGYGIKSIEKTIRKYNGFCNWNFDESNNEFHFNVLFNRP